MEKIDYKFAELRSMDELAEIDSPVRRLHPLAKLIVTIAYIYVTLSFGKYDLSGLFFMLLYPVILFQISGIRIRSCFIKLKMIIPLVCIVGIFNPIIDRSILIDAESSVLPFAVTGGLVSMITMMMKGIFSLMASFLLAATTPVDEICSALRRIHVPELLVSLVLLTYRYISMFIEELSAMMTAYRLRAPNDNGIAVSAWGSFLGQLFLRSMDRAQEIYTSMELRGFSGDFLYAGVRKLGAGDVLFIVVAAAMFIFTRLVNITAALGSIVS